MDQTDVYYDNSILKHKPYSSYNELNSKIFNQELVNLSAKKMYQFETMENKNSNYKIIFLILLFFLILFLNLYLYFYLFQKK
jgi:hypothetical protein